jgi:hypothetical protein
MELSPIPLAFCMDLNKRSTLSIYPSIKFVIPSVRYNCVDLELKKLITRVKELGYTVKIMKSTKDFLSEAGYDEEYGARPLNRAIQKFIEDPISEEILKGKC